MNIVNKKVLRAKIIENGYTQEQFAKIIGISKASLSYKMNGKSDFSLSEIHTICDSLNLDAETRKKIFLI